MTSLDKFVLDARSYQTTASQATQQNLEQMRRDVYDSHRHRVFSLAYYMTHNETEAEQLLIQTFKRGFLAPSLPDGTTLDGLLIEELQRADILDGALLQAEPHDRAEKVECDAEMSEKGVRRTDLEEALQLLNPQLRFIFLLHDVEGYDLEQIALLLKITPEQSSKNVFEARLAMRMALIKTKALRSKLD